MRRHLTLPFFRSALRLALLAGCYALIAGQPAYTEAPAEDLPHQLQVVSADAAVTRLKAGNQRYVAHKLEHPDQTEARLHEVEQAQHPFAVVLGCSDSRVPPEILFDQGLGDLFVVRVAGNVPDDEVIGSIEYAVHHLHTPLVLVLGHEKCGAVTAATGEPEANHTRSFTDWLRPVVAEARKQEGDLVHNAMCLMVSRIVKQLKASEPVLKGAVLESKVKIVGAHYDLHTGRVVWDRESEDDVLSWLRGGSVSGL